MSNRANIQQETVTVRHTGETSKVIEVFDNYGQGSIAIETCDLEDFVDNELELLALVFQAIETGGLDNIATILTSVQENETGMSIEGTWYDWEELKPIFDKHN